MFRSVYLLSSCFFLIIMQLIWIFSVLEDFLINFSDLVISNIIFIFTTSCPLAINIYGSLYYRQELPQIVNCKLLCSLSFPFPYVVISACLSVATFGDCIYWESVVLSALCDNRKGGSTFGYFYTVTKAQLVAQAQHTHTRGLIKRLLLCRPRPPPSVFYAPGIVNSIVTLLNGIFAFKYATKKATEPDRAAAATSRLLLVVLVWVWPGPILVLLLVLVLALVEAALRFISAPNAICGRPMWAGRRRRRRRGEGVGVGTNSELDTRSLELNTWARNLVAALALLCENHNDNKANQRLEHPLALTPPVLQYLPPH